jgi:hypothetical protein
VEIAYPPSRQRDVELLLTALDAELPMAEVPAPPPGFYPPI